MTIQEDIAQRFPKEAELHTFYDGLISDVSRELRSRYLDHLENYRKVELGLGVKGMKSWRAITTLFFGGYEEDAEIVLRSLVDVVIDMKFISLDPDERARRFVDYTAVHLWRWMREAKARDLITDPAELDRLEKDLESRTQEVFTRRPEWKQRLPIGWSEKTTPQKVDEVGERLIYFSFMSGSQQTHPNPVSVADYFSPVDSGKLDFKIEPTVPADSKVFMEACIFLHRLVDHLNDVIHLGMDKRCEESRDRGDDLMKTYLARRRPRKQEH
jgi:hypothetical protein